MGNALDTIKIGKLYRRNHFDKPVDCPILKREKKKEHCI